MKLFLACLLIVLVCVCAKPAKNSGGIGPQTPNFPQEMLPNIPQNFDQNYGQFAPQMGPNGQILPQMGSNGQFIPQMGPNSQSLGTYQVRPNRNGPANGSPGMFTRMYNVFAAWPDMMAKSAEQTMGRLPVVNILPRMAEGAIKAGRGVASNVDNMMKVFMGGNRANRRQNTAQNNLMGGMMNGFNQMNPLNGGQNGVGYNPMPGMMNEEYGGTPGVIDPPGRQPKH